MTQTRRLFLNVFASHGRALFVLMCGLLTGRWALMALGQVDYGLFGLIGGLMVFISLINNVLASAVSRFFAYSIGARTKINGDEGLEDCRRWFNVALFVHTIVPLILIIIGYPVGMYVIRQGLNIPADRLVACEWVFRWTCLSAFLGMITVPYRALYTARQYMVELTVYSVFQTALNVAVLYYMVEHPRDWLTWMAMWTVVQASSVNVILMVRSFWIFPECRFRIKYMWDVLRLRQLSAYAGWQFLSALGLAVRTQGMAILVNKYFSPIMNSSCTVANTVAGQSQTFAREVDLAFGPAIYTAYGAGDKSLQRALVYRCSKFATWLVLLFVMPLILEMKYVLVLWLKEPPPYTAGISIFLCLMLLTEKMSSGQLSAVNGVGNVKLLKTISCASFFATLAVAWIGFSLGANMYMVGIASWSMSLVDSAFHILIARKVADVPIRPWLNQVVIPLTLLSFICVAIGLLPRLCLPASFMRVVLTAFFFIVPFLGLSWVFALTQEERQFVKSKVTQIVSRMRGGIVA